MIRNHDTRTKPWWRWTSPGIGYSLVLLGLVCSSPVAAQSDRVRVLEALESGQFQVPLYKSGLILLDRPAHRISVGNPGIADILTLRSTQLYVVGKALGSTNVVVWDRGNRIFGSLDIEVTHDLDTLKTKLHELLPGENIKVHSAQERIILSGEASNVVKMNAAGELAASFLPECIAPESTETKEKGGGGGQACVEGSVVNLMQVGGAHQVMLEIKVAEIARTVLKALDSDVQFLFFGEDARTGLIKGGASFPDALTPDGLRVPIFGPFDGSEPVVGPAVEELTPSDPSIADTGAFLSHLSGDFLFQWVLDVSREKGLAKILAEPTLTTLTGQQAEFLSGGEFPIPVPQGGNNNTITIEFKEFGVGVRFVPVVLDSGRISLKLNVSVSELSTANTVGLDFQGTQSTFVVPSLTKRSTATTVELANGQTIGISGLINDSTRELVSKFPVLGDVPVLGALFRSQEYQSGQTELVMFVTPHLARPMAAQEVWLPTDSWIPASDLEFYLLGRMEAGRAPSSPAATDQGPAQGGGPEGSGDFGHEF